MRKILLLSLLLVAFANVAQAQTFVPSLLRLRDDAHTERIFLLKDNGDYLLTFNIDALRIESHGSLIRNGCSVKMEEVTDRYRMVMVGDVCARTGKVVLQVFGIGNFTILDKTRDSQTD